jgi:hypothetical protein
LNYNTKYYWKVAGYNTNGVGQYSNIWNFTTLNMLPLQVSLLSPSNGSTNVPLTPTLFWNTTTGAASYRVQVSPTNTFSYIVDSATVSTNQRAIPPGKLNLATTYFWRVQGINSFGNGPWSAVWSFFTVVTSVQQLGTVIPKEFDLYQNTPNPFNPSTKIRYDLPKNELVKLFVFDALGRKIETLVNETQSAGTYEATFNASQLPSGIYFARLEAGTYNNIIKMLMVK